MRSREDLKAVRFEMVGGITLDIQRVEQDPAWSMASRFYDLEDTQQFDAALVEYVKHYLSKESLLAEMPSTNGPADIYGLNAVGPHEARRQKEAARAARAEADAPAVDV